MLVDCCMRSLRLRRVGRRGLHYTKNAYAVSQKRGASGFSPSVDPEGRIAVNPLHPRQMSPKERLAEICDLLAFGLIRRALDGTAPHIAPERPRGAA